MKLVLMQVGKTTNAHIETLTADYAARLKHYVAFETLTVPELKNTKGLSEAQQKEREADGIEKNLQAGDFVVLLDEHGKSFRSVELAAWLQSRMQLSPKRMVFIIGGPYGFSQRIYQRANAQLSLSPLTFSHQMVRLFFTEQLYRAMTILKGEPYHHE